ncbi:uncharacterized protein LOC132726557 [Ruditapes philippinarum]|uniref:uncharacterized protein LOC132726557 n=1 Tax=Ruditapes philippinarum TaxID=129788 RepID=UPI00295B0F48|nr:uncharacterized protein LOC132726557 [Ruditapes philippinarum]
MYSRFKTEVLQDSNSEPTKPASQLTCKVVKQFIDGLKKKNEPSKAAQCLGQTTKDDVMRWLDENDLDLMHHVILLNNPEAIEYLLSHGYFQAPFEPRTNLYAHLACYLGYRTCLNIILQYRKDDNRPSKKITYNQNGNGITERRREISPIDIAAEAGHLPCVKQILTQCVLQDHADFTDFPYVALACIPQSVLSLQLILKKDKPKADDIKKAIEVSLMKASAQCLDLLLQQKVKTDDMFGKRNFFHMLYTFSQTTQFGTEGYRRLPEVTQVLVKHKYSVKTTNPPNTYPMYSLIKNSVCVYDYVNTRHYVMCLRILIEAGADPNFDETEAEKKLNARGVKSEHGRMSYSSAMHCLLETVEIFSEYLESKALGVRFVVQMAEVLIQNKAQLNSVGRIGDKTSNRFGTVLHQFAKCSVKLGVDTDIFKYLLRQGADPNAKASNGKYVINTFLDILLSELKEFSSHSTPADHTENVQTMLGLSLFMTRQCVKETLDILNKDFTKPPHHMKKYVQIAQKELSERAKEVWPLKRLCRVLIWDLCKRDASIVTKLPTDIESRTYILPSI